MRTTKRDIVGAIIMSKDKLAEELGNKPTEELEIIQWFTSEELKDIKIASPTLKLLKDVKIIL